MAFDSKGKNSSNSESANELRGQESSEVRRTAKFMNKSTSGSGAHKDLDLVKNESFQSNDAAKLPTIELQNNVISQPDEFFRTYNNKTG